MISAAGMLQSITSIPYEDAKVVDYCIVDCHHATQGPL